MLLTAVVVHGVDDRTCALEDLGGWEADLVEALHAETYESTRISLYANNAYLVVATASLEEQ